MDGAKEEAAVGPFDDDLPPLIPAGAHNSPILDEVLPHPSTIGRITDEPPPYSTEAIDFRPPAALATGKEGEPRRAHDPSWECFADGGDACQQKRAHPRAGSPKST